MERKKVIPVLAAFWTAIAVSLSGVFVEESSFLATFNAEAEGIRLDKLLVLAGLLFLYSKTWQVFRKTRSWITHLLAVLFSACMLIGISYSTQGNWNFIFGNGKQFVIAMGAFVGYAVLFDVCISLLYRWLEEHSIYRTKPRKPFPDFVEKHYRLCAFLTIWICWLPYLICFFPGSVPADGYRQLDMYFGGERFTTRHAWVLTMFVGMLMSIGRMISDNAGVFLIVLVTALIECCCYATVCDRIKKWKAPKPFCIVSVLFFGLTPVFGAYAQTVIKDSIFSSLLALFLVLYAECAIPALQKRSRVKLKKQIVILTVVGMLACLCRNNGIYLIFPAMLLLIFLMSKKERLLILVMAAALFTGYEGTQKVLAPMLGISSISSRVYFSIPFQQTARYLKTWPDDVTEEEKEAIDAILHYDKLAERYNPDLSDPVKATYRSGKITKEKLVNYFKAWFSMFLRHPDVYVEATLHNTYGYYYPFYHASVQGPYRFYMRECIRYQFDYHYVMPEKVRRTMVMIAYSWSYIPGLAQICNAGTYTWALLILAGYLIHRKRGKGILFLAAPFLNVLVCIASPVNGLYRYAFPVVACMPVVIYWCLGYGERRFMETMEEDLPGGELRQEAVQLTDGSAADGNPGRPSGEV